MQTKQQTKHTPLPYELTSFWTIREGNNYELISKSRMVIAKLGCDKGTNNAQANAEFIVRAVNSHYELLKACKWALDYLENPESTESIGLHAIDLLKQAIERAEQ